MEQTDCRSAASAHSDLQGGEVLLMRRMGFAPPIAPISSVSKRAYGDFFARNLTSSEVEALDVLFPATNATTGRRLFSDDEAESCGR